MLESTYNFTNSSCSFFGSISSIYGSSKGYDSRTLARMPRWTLDFTLDLEPGVMLADLVSLFTLVIYKRRVLHTLF